MKIEFVFDGQPVPYTRMTNRSKWANPQAKRYISYKNDLADYLRAMFRSQVDDTFLGFYRLVLEVFVKNAVRGDVDNYLKAASDSIQSAGMVINDKQIVEAQGRVFIDPEHPRVEAVLERIEEHTPKLNLRGRVGNG